MRDIMYNDGRRIADRRRELPGTPSAKIPFLAPWEVFLRNIYFVSANSRLGGRPVGLKTKTPRDARIFKENCKFRVSGDYHFRMDVRSPIGLAQLHSRRMAINPKYGTFTAKPLSTYAPRNAQKAFVSLKGDTCDPPRRKVGSRKVSSKRELLTARSYLTTKPIA